MGKLIRMDLYRMLKSKTFLVCLTVAFVLALANAPVAKLMYTLANSLSSEINETFANEVNLSSILTDPFPMMGLMLALLSLCFFFYADVENGYIKNIAGQMPRKGYTVLSKFIAAIAHNLLFMIVGVAFNLIGTLPFKRIEMGNLAESISVFGLKFLLAQSLCAVLLLTSSSLRSKSLSSVLAVLMGTGMMWLVYIGIDAGISQVIKDYDIALGNYITNMVKYADKRAEIRFSMTGSKVSVIFKNDSVNDKKSNTDKINNNGMGVEINENIMKILGIDCGSYMKGKETIFWFETEKA